MTQQKKYQTLIIFCADKGTNPSSEYIKQLKLFGYKVDMATCEAVIELLENAITPDMIISYSHKDCHRLTEHVSQYSSEIRLPIIICLQKVKTALNGSFYVLPRDPKTALPQILATLQIRSEYHKLEKEIRQLQGVQDDFIQSAEKQKRTSRATELLKNAIVRNVSHELRTPLLQIKAAVSLIAEDVDNSELINLAKGATSRLETLVKNITMLGSSLDPQRSAVIVPETIEYAKRNLSRAWSQRDTLERIELQLAESLPAVHADKVGLGTVLQLLIDNALKFSDLAVTVSVAQINDTVKFEVRDKGIGIPDVQLEHIFEVFYQIENSPTRTYGGTGVGLALVKLILENHDTDIHVNSEVGKGTAFTFSLPVYQW